MRRLPLLICGLVLGLFGAAAIEPPLKRVVERRVVMGVEGRITVYAPSEAEARNAMRQAFLRIEAIEQSISSWRPGSAARTLCGRVGETVRLDPDLFAVLARSKWWRDRSDGAFDPTVGPLVDAWRTARQEGARPDDERLSEAKARSGWKHLRLDLGARTARVTIDGMRFDFGGIGKGYAADQALVVLRANGLGSAMVELGGDLVVGDPPPGRDGWTVAIETVPGDDDEIIELANGAVATSGDVEQFVEIDGVRFSHLLDPKTGLGLRDRVQVTAVVAGGTSPGTDADALASAASILAADEDRLNDLLSGVAGSSLRIVRAEPSLRIDRVEPTPAGVVATGAELEVVFDGGEFTEGPAAAPDGRVFFTDQPGDRILCVELDGSVTTFMSPCGRSNGLAFDGDGALWACADGGNELWRISPGGDRTVALTGFDGKPFNGPNDIWIAPDGSRYFTDPFYRRPYWTDPKPRQDTEAVYRLDPDGTLERVADQFTRPNGIIGSPDARTLYVADIGAGKTLAFELEADGGLAGRRTFCDLGSDGMTVDDAGNVYLTGRGVVVFDPQGRLIERIPVPEQWTANVCIGGADRRDLYITAMGRVYRVRLRHQAVWSP